MPRFIAAFELEIRYSSSLSSGLTRPSLNTVPFRFIIKGSSEGGGRLCTTLSMRCDILPFAASKASLSVVLLSFEGPHADNNNMHANDVHIYRFLCNCFMVWSVLRNRLCAFCL